jgi:inosine-uridine nucleoside N-ribohydrolase
MLLIDTDNALGSPWGDVDDGFALAALLTSGSPVAALVSVAGNTSEARAFANNRVLGDLADYQGRYLRGAQATGGLSGRRIDEAAELWGNLETPLRWLALGPLTNLAAVLAREPRPRIAEVVLVGGNLSSRGRWPPYWPIEFNLTQDRAAARAVFDSALPLTIVPLDVARRLRAGPRQLAGLCGPLGEHLAQGARRWLWRSRLLKGRDSIALFDLLAAAHAIFPDLVHAETAAVRLTPGMLVERAPGQGTGSRPARIVRSFDGEAIWARFRAQITQVKERP